MNILRIILTIIIIALSSYGLLTDTSGVIIPYVLLLMGVLLIVMGIAEFQKRKAGAFSFFLAAGFVLFVSVYIY